MQFTSAERRILARLSDPEKLQQFLDDRITYDTEPDGPRCRSPRVTLRDRVGHCVGGSLLAMAALEYHCYEPRILMMRAVRDNDHLVTVFRRRSGWGAVGKSNFTGLRFRSPVYRSVRELVMSYFEHYFNPQGEKTLRRFARPVGLERFEHLNWRTSEEDLWPVYNHLYSLPTRDVLSQPARYRRYWSDGQTLAAGRLGY